VKGLMERGFINFMKSLEADRETGWPLRLLGHPHLIRYSIEIRELFSFNEPYADLFRSS
jgi:hypothetical protein